MASTSKRISQGLLVAILALIFFSLIDFVIWGGEVLLNDILEYAKSRNTALSVLLSALLLIAYLMQYLIQDTQTDLASRQEKLMEAGYTPIVGVKSREWGKQRSDEADIETFEANKYYVQLVNNGNSAARDLRLWIGIEYDPNNNETYYSSTTVPLQRTDEGTWWPTDVGGALSESTDDGTEFVADPKLTKVKKGGLLSKDEEIEKIEIGQALKSMCESGVEEVSIALSIRYTTATGDDQEIKVGIYREKLATLADVGWTVYDTQESSSDEFEEIKESAL